MPPVVLAALKLPTVWRRQFYDAGGRHAQRAGVDQADRFLDAGALQAHAARGIQNRAGDADAARVDDPDRAAAGLANGGDGQRAAVFVRLMGPLVAFVALKLLTVSAPPSVWPVPERVVSRPVVPKAPLPDSVIAPAAVASIGAETLADRGVDQRLPPVASSVTAPEPPAVTAAPMVSVPVEVRPIAPLAAVLTMPVVVRAPVLLTVTLPPPVSLMLVMVSGAAVLVSWMPLAEASVALKLLTVFALPSVWPVPETVVSRPVVLKCAGARLGDCTGGRGVDRPG